MNTSTHGDTSPSLGPLGLTEQVRLRLAELAGAEPVAFYILTDNKQQRWTEAGTVTRLVKRRPMFATTTWNAPDPDNADRRVHLAGGVWIDLDVKDKALGVQEAIQDLKHTAGYLQDLGIPLECCSLFASGGKGFHIFIPLELLAPKGLACVTLSMARSWWRICRMFVFENLFTGCLDTGIYNGGQGRLIRQPGILRDNGAFKVPLAWAEGLSMTQQGYAAACAEPRPHIEPALVAGLAEGAAIAWRKAVDKMTKAVAKAKPTKPLALGSGGNLLTTDRGKIVAALKVLAGKADYSGWVTVGAALKSTGAVDAFDLWDAFSKTFPGYSRALCEYKWDSFNGSSIGSVYWLANQAKKGGRK